MPNLLITNINTSIDGVLLPTMAAEQDNREKVKAMTRRSIKISTYILMPALMGLAVCAEPLIALLFTEKWLPCVPYLRIFCFVYAIYPMHTANLNAIKAVGKSDLFLKLEVIKKVVGITAVLITMWYGVMPMALSLMVTTILNSIINAFPNRKLLNYKYGEQLFDIMPTVLLTAVMSVCVYFVTWLPLNNIVQLLIQIPLGVVIYVAGSKLFRNENFEYILSAVKGMLRRKTKQQYNGRGG